MNTYVLVGTKKGAWIYTSDTKRETWTVSEPIFAGWTVNHLAVDVRRDPPRIYAAANHWAWGRSVARSDDLGKTWEQRSPGLSFAEDMGLSVEGVWHVAPGHASKPGVVYAGTQPGGLFKSEDWGDSWTMVDGLMRHPYRQFWSDTGGGASALHSILVDPRDGNRLFASVSTGGTYNSRDGGETWDLCSHGFVATSEAARELMKMFEEFFADQPQPQLPEGVDPAAMDEFHKLLIDPKNPDRLWGQAHIGVFRSDKQAEGWEDVTANLPSFHGFPIAVTRRNPDAVFVVPLEFGENNFRVVNGQFAVWRTTDQGKSWEPLTKGLPGPHDYQSCYREAMDTDGLESEGVYVGTTNGQLYASRDVGETWMRMPGTLPPILSVTAAAF